MEAQLIKYILSSKPQKICIICQRKMCCAGSKSLTEARFLQLHAFPAGTSCTCKCMAGCTDNMQNIYRNTAPVSSSLSLFWLISGLAQTVCLVAGPGSQSPQLLMPGPWIDWQGIIWALPSAIVSSLLCECVDDLRYNLT